MRLKLPQSMLTFIEHLEDLRARIIKSIIAIVVLSAALYPWTDKILDFLARPVGRLVFIHPLEAFLTSIKLAFFGGLFLSSPFLIYHIWAFLSAALDEKWKRYTFLFWFFSSLVFMLGALFGYFIVVPLGIKFLLGFSTDFVVPMISMGEYVSFVGVMMFLFGIVFQLPIAVTVLGIAGIITAGFLSKNRKYAVLIIFIVAAILTPPDAVTQCLLALPLIVLYELSICLLKIFSKNT